MTPMEIALLTNAALDILATLKQVGVKITPEDIDKHVAKRQAEIDSLDAEINT